MDRQGLISCGRNLAPVVNDRRLANSRLLHETGMVCTWGGDGVLLGAALAILPSRSARFIRGRDAGIPVLTSVRLLSTHRKMPWEREGSVRAGFLC
jgi:hypothetical protein